MINNKISLVLEKARKFIESLRRSIPYSVTKVKVRVELLYQTAKKKVKQNKNIDIAVMAKRKEEAGIEIDTDDIEIINEELHKL